MARKRPNKQRNQAGRRTTGSNDDSGGGVRRSRKKGGGISRQLAAGTGGLHQLQEAHGAGKAGVQQLRQRQPAVRDTTGTG